MTFVDGTELGDPTATALRDRRSISRDGVMFVVATVSEQDGSTVAPPEVVVRGMPHRDEIEALVSSVQEVVEDRLDQAADDDVHEVDAIEDRLHDALAKALHKRAQRRPMIMPVVVEV